MATIESLEQVEAVLDSLAAHGYSRRLHRRPGQKEDRFEQLLGGASEEPGAGADDPRTAGPVASAAAAGPGGGAAADPARGAPGLPTQQPDGGAMPADGAASSRGLDLERRVRDLEDELRELRAALARLEGVVHEFLET
jgi:uncharacterized protein YceH (UPF0502 family)